MNKAKMCKHEWVSVADVDHSLCKKCFVTTEMMSPIIVPTYPKGFCPHSWQVCQKCGLPRGYGSCGEMQIIPQSCRKQLCSMFSENKKEKRMKKKSNMCKEDLMGVEAPKMFMSSLVNAIAEFRNDHQLKTPSSMHEVCNAMSDKHGRVCRYVKHIERIDPKPEWKEEMATAMAGYIVYMVMLARHYGIHMGKGLEDELKKAIEQHSK